MSSWSKTEDHVREYAIRFMDQPPSPAAVYCARQPPAGKTSSSSTPMHSTVTAAQLITWFLKRRDQAFPFSNLLFPNQPTGHAKRRALFQSWLRTTLSKVYPDFTKALLVRPHGLRAGWVCDRRREGAPDHTIMREGRWASASAMGLYDRVCFQQTHSSPSFRFLYSPG